MRNFLLTSIVAATVAPWTTPALAHDQDPDNVADLRCFIVGLKLAQNSSPQLQAAGQLAVLYYLGRLDGRAPNFDIENAVVDQMSKMAPKDYATEATRCGQALSDKGQKVTQLGKNLVERGQKMQEQENKASK